MCHVLVVSCTNPVQKGQQTNIQTTAPLVKGRKPLGLSDGNLEPVQLWFSLSLLNENSVD